MTRHRRLSPLDRVLAEVQRGIAGAAGDPVAARDNPGAPQPDVQMAECQRRHAAGLMRVNHTGEVCAQAQVDEVLSANQGCRMHLANGNVPVRHPLELLAEFLA